MTAAEVVKVDNVKLRFDFISPFMFKKMILDNPGEIFIFKIIDEHAEAFFDVLPDDVLNNKIRFAGAGGTHNKQATHGVDNVNPIVADFSFEIIRGGQVNGVFIFQQTFFLQKRLVVFIENIFG